jgi:hypothetical protein
MSDPDKPVNEPRVARSKRRAPVIELKAEEILAAETQAGAAKTQPDPSAEEVHAAELAPEPAAEKKAPEPEPQPEPLVTPPPPVESPSMTLPLAAAALAGALFGGLGGTLVPALFGNGKGAETTKIAALERSQADLARQLQSLPAAAALTQIQQKLSALETNVAKRVSDATGPIAQNVLSLEGEVRTLAARPTASGAPAPVDLSPVQQRIAALEGQLRTLDAKAEAAGKAADPRIAALDQKLDQTARRMEAGSAAPLFSAVQGLAQAFHRGVPFRNEFTAVEVLGAKPEQLAALKPLSEIGAPTPQVLAAAFAPLAAKLAGAEGGFWGFVNRFATVRPTEESAGDQPAAIVGSIEAALRRGDGAAALAAWNRLPESARQASAGWGAQAAERDRAAKALAALQDAATAALRK